MTRKFLLILSVVSILLSCSFTNTEDDASFDDYFIQNNSTSRSVSSSKVKILVLNAAVDAVIPNDYESKAQEIGYGKWVSDYKTAKNGTDFQYFFDSRVVDTFFFDNDGQREYCRSIEQKAADYYDLYIREGQAAATPGVPTSTDYYILIGFSQGGLTARRMMQLEDTMLKTGGITKRKIIGVATDSSPNRGVPALEPDVLLSGLGNITQKMIGDLIFNSSQSNPDFTKKLNATISLFKALGSIFGSNSTNSSSSNSGATSRTLADNYLNLVTYFNNYYPNKNVYPVSLEDLNRQYEEYIAKNVSASPGDNNTETRSLSSNQYQPAFIHNAVQDTNMHSIYNKLYLINWSLYRLMENGYLGGTNSLANMYFIAYNNYGVDQNWNIYLDIDEEKYLCDLHLPFYKWIPAHHIPSEEERSIFGALYQMRKTWNKPGQVNYDIINDLSFIDRLNSYSEPDIHRAAFYGTCQELIIEGRDLLAEMSDAYGMDIRDMVDQAISGDSNDNCDLLVPQSSALYPVETNTSSKFYGNIAIPTLNHLNHTNGNTQLINEMGNFIATVLSSSLAEDQPIVQTQYVAYLPSSNSFSSTYEYWQWGTDYTFPFYSVSASVGIDGLVYLFQNDGTKYIVWNPVTSKFSNLYNLTEWGGGGCPINAVGAAELIGDWVYMFDIAGTSYAAWNYRTGVFTQIYNVSGWGGGGCPLSAVGSLVLMGDWVYMFSKEGNSYAGWNYKTGVFSRIYSLTEWGGGGCPLTDIKSIVSSPDGLIYMLQ